MTTHLDPIDVRGFDSLVPQRRQEVLEHVERCPACRAELIASDPSRLFALLALEPIPAEALEALSGRVTAELDRQDDRRGTGARWGLVGSLAASLLLAGLFSGYLATRPALPTLDARGPATDVVEIEPSLGRTSSPGGIELISSPGEAQVLELSVGETQVVMIFDDELDI